jgi:hypothetical protein
MKRITLAIVIALFSTALFAQETNSNASKEEMNTLFGKGSKTTIGWFIAPTGGYTRFDSYDVGLAGIQAGMIINHHFTIGLAGYAVANSDYLTFNNFVDTTDARLEGGYGGLLLEYTLFPKSVVHVSFPLIIGGGSMGYYTANEQDEWDGEDWENCDHRQVDQDPFFVVIPGVNAEVNILKFMRLGVGVSYRYTPDLNLINTSTGFINNFTAAATLKFGKF